MGLVPSLVANQMFCDMKPMFFIETDARSDLKGAQNCWVYCAMC